MTDAPSHPGDTPLTATFVSLFPDSVRSHTDTSILGRAQKSGRLAVKGVQIRDFATDKHRTVDDTPCGGGAGLVMRVDVVRAAIDAALEDSPVPRARTRVIALDPTGVRFDNAQAKRLGQYAHLVFVCGRYEGFDARVYDAIDEAVSIGDFVLTGGELAATVVLDAVARFVPGVLGNAASHVDESHAAGLLEHRQYTRPVTHDGATVPAVLLSGNHAAIAEARAADALHRTRLHRPDLAAQLPAPPAGKAGKAMRKIHALAEGHEAPTPGHQTGPLAPAYEVNGEGTPSADASGAGDTAEAPGA